MSKIEGVEGLKGAESIGFDPDRRNVIIGTIVTGVAATLGLSGCDEEKEGVENNDPIINKISGKTEILENEKLKLTAYVTDVETKEDKLSYFWMIIDSKDNSLYESTNKTLEFDGLENAGDYSVVLIVQDENGGKARDSVTIKVNEKPEQITDGNTTIEKPILESKTDTSIKITEGDFKDDDGVRNVVIVCYLDNSEIATIGDGEENFTGLDASTTYEFSMRGEAYNKKTGVWETKEGEKIAITTDETPNEAPEAVNDSYDTDYETTVSGNVLTNDTDAEGDTITVISHTEPSNGTLTIADNGDFTYTPNDGFSGTDTFTYTINGGDEATVTINVAEAPDTITETNQTNINLEDNGVNPSFDINIDDSVDPNNVNLHFEYIYVHDGDQEETYAEDRTLAGVATGDWIDLNNEGKLYVKVTQNGNTYHTEFYNEDSGRLSAIKKVDIDITDSNNDDNVHFEK